MKNKFIEEFKWRGMIQDTTPEIEKYLNENIGVAYLGNRPYSRFFTYRASCFYYDVKAFSNTWK